MSLQDRTFLRLALAGVLIAGLGLAACGRKGMELDLPPSATGDTADKQVVVDPDGTQRTRKPLPIDVLLN